MGPDEGLRSVRIPTFQRLHDLPVLPGRRPELFLRQGQKQGESRQPKYGLGVLQEAGLALGGRLAELPPIAHQQTAEEGAVARYGG